MPRLRRASKREPTTSVVIAKGRVFVAGELFVFDTITPTLE